MTTKSTPWRFKAPRRGSAWSDLPRSSGVIFLRLLERGFSPSIRSYEVGKFETFLDALFGSQLQIGPIETQIHSRVPPPCFQHQLLPHQVKELGQGLHRRRDPFLLYPRDRRLGSARPSRQALLAEA